MLRWISFLALTSCADARDLLRPYHPDSAEVRAMLERPMPTMPVDVAIVLGVPADPGGKLSLAQACRVDLAVALYRQGVMKNIIFSGGAAHSIDVEADVMANAAVDRGVPNEHVFREGRALTTWQNIRFAKKIMKREGFHTTVFVSTSDHLPRARRIAQFYGFDDALTGYRACDAGSFRQELEHQQKSDDAEKNNQKE